MKSFLEISGAFLSLRYAYWSRPTGPVFSRKQQLESHQTKHHAFLPWKVLRETVQKLQRFLCRTKVMGTSCEKVH